MIAHQTILAAVGYGLIILSMVITALRTRSPYLALYFFFLYSIASAIALYGMNCMVTGNCNIFAWIVASLVILSGLISLIMPFIPRAVDI